MPVPRLAPSRCALLVIDLQERMMPTIHDADATITNTVAMIEIARLLSIPILATEQYTKGLGRSVPAIANALPSDATVFEKTQFSAIVPEVDAALRRLDRPDILLCGVETHICILQTTLDLLASGRQPILISDAVSSSEPTQANHAIRRAERCGALTSGVLSASYELMQDASHQAFRSILTVVKARKLPASDLA